MQSQTVTQSQKLAKSVLVPSPLIQQGCRDDKLTQKTLLQPHSYSAADDKGGVGRRGKLSCHWYIEDPTGNHPWLLLAASCGPTWSQCPRVICPAKRSVPATLGTTAGCQHEDHEEVSPHIRHAWGAWQELFSHGWAQWPTCLQLEGILPVIQGWSLPHKYSKSCHCKRQRQGWKKASSSHRAVHANCSHHIPAHGTPWQCVMSGNKTHSHGCMTQVTKGMRHKNLEVQNNKLFSFLTLCTCSGEHPIVTSPGSGGWRLKW